MTMRLCTGLLAAGALFAAGSQPTFAQVFAAGGQGVNGAATLNRQFDTAPTKPVHEEDTGLITTKIRQGVFTIDGFTGKVQLSYDIVKVPFLYFYVPGTGTAVVSLKKVPDATLVKNAFDGSTLAFDSGGHHFVLNNATPLLFTKKKHKPAKVDAYVRFDATANHYASTPQMGFGYNAAEPYAWPEAMPETPAELASSHTPIAPPLPASVLPRVMPRTQTVALAAKR